jgi:hypothetical protein
MSLSTVKSAAIVAIITVVVSGCTKDSLQRLAYGAVQNAGQETCINTSPAAKTIHCLGSVSYDQYKRDRAEVNSSY